MLCIRTKPPVAPILLQGAITREHYHFISKLMYKCAKSVFKCRDSAWMIADDLCIHRVDLFSPRYLVQTIYNNASMEYSKEAVEAMHTRLIRNVFALILFFHQEGEWEPTRMNLIAICITIAEVTEEISFIFRGISPLLMKCVKYARTDKGVLLGLAARYTE